VNTQGVLITGASGFIGRHVVRRFDERGVEVWAWTRNAARTRALFPARIHVVEELTRIPAEAPIGAIVNLAGAPVIGPPWTSRRRQLLIDSRVGTTHAVLGWCAQRAQPPRVLISASAIGYYGPADDQWFDESAPPQDAFQSQLCVARELAANSAASLGIRAVNLRIGLVMGADGGILPRLALPARLGLAAVIGDGLQWMSWIHIDDLLRIIDLSIEDAALSGAVNSVAPEPVRQRNFQCALTHLLHRPLWLRVPAFALRASLGDMAELLVRGQRVTPRRLLEQGFEFRYRQIEAALANLLTRARS